MAGELITKSLLVALAVIAAAGQDCASYSCKTASINFADDTCLHSPNNPSSSHFYARYCQGGLCMQTTAQNFTCQFVNETVTEVLPGERCDNYKYVCGYANQTCSVSRQCEGFSFNETCVTNEDCNPGLRCTDSGSDGLRCMHLLSDGDSSCHSDFDCQLDSGCNLETHECMKYFSVGEGQSIDPQLCNLNSHTSMFCENGYCDLGSDGNTYCIDLVKSKHAAPNECSFSTADSDCSGESAFSETPLYSTCSCGYGTKGKAYCSPFFGDEVGSIYLARMKEWIASPENQLHCNTVSRSSTKCMLDWWDPEKAGELVYYSNQFSLYPFLQDLDECVKTTLFESPPFTAQPFSSHVINK